MGSDSVGSAPSRVSFDELDKGGVLALGDGYRTRRDELGRPGFPILRVAQIGEGAIDGEPTDFVRHEYARAIGPKLSQVDDVVLTTKGTFGRRTRIRPGQAGYAYSPQVCWFRIQDPAHLDPGYLYYWLGSADFANQASGLKSQTDMADYLSLRDLRRVQVPLPAVAEQRRIAGILGALDDKIELNRRTSETLEMMARALFEASFGVLNTDHAPSALGDVADVIDCLHAKKPDRRDVGRPLLHLGNIRDDGLLDMSDSYLIDDRDYQVWTSRVEARPGDCVITNVGRVGAVAQIPLGVSAALGRNMTAVRCRPNFPYPTFLLEALRSDAMRAEIERKTDAGTILSALNVRSIPRLQLPTFDRDGTERYERVARPLRARMELALAESHALRKTRDALLPRLLSGASAA